MYRRNFLAEMHLEVTNISGEFFIMSINKKLSGRSNMSEKVWKPREMNVLHIMYQRHLPGCVHCVAISVSNRSSKISPYLVRNPIQINAIPNHLMSVLPKHPRYGYFLISLISIKPLPDTQVLHNVQQLSIPKPSYSPSFAQFQVSSSRVYM